MNATGKGGFRDNPQNINREGAPRKQETLTYALDNIIDDDELAATLWELAVTMKNLGAVKYIFDRVCGKPKEKIEHSGDVERPIFIIEGDKD